MIHKRTDPDGIAYYARKLAGGKGKKGALRYVKRRVSDVVYRHLLDDLATVSPGGQMGASLQSSAADQIPTIDTSEQSLPGLDTDATPTTANRVKRAS